MAALMILHQKIVLLPLAPYLENFIGALDGTHIPAHVPATQAALIAIAKAIYHKMSLASVIWI